jgi:hypothetical protein
MGAEIRRSASYADQSNYCWAADIQSDSEVVKHCGSADANINPSVAE